MSAIYSQGWHEDMQRLINGSERFRQRAPQQRIAMTLEVMGDESSPYVGEGNALYYLVVLDGGKVTEYRPLDARHDGKQLGFRFTAPASIWEAIAAGQLDPITAGLRGQIRIRGDMRFLMENADAVKELVDVYAHQNDTEWPKGRPPYAPAAT
jgi:hypothetical protein